MNVSSKLLLIPKQMMIAHGPGSPTIIAQSSGLSEPITEESEVNAVYKSNESRESLMRAHEAVKKIDEEGLDQDWQRVVKVSDSYVKYNDVFIEMISDFASMLDGHLEQIIVWKHRIELSPGVAQPIHAAQYRAGPNAREFEKHLIDKLLSGKVTSGSDRMGTINRFHAQEIRFFSLLRQIPETKLCYEARRQFDNTHGRMY